MNLFALSRPRSAAEIGNCENCVVKLDQSFRAPHQRPFPVGDKRNQMFGGDEPSGAPAHKRCVWKDQIRFITGADKPVPTHAVISRTAHCRASYPNQSQTARVDVIELCGTQFWHVPEATA